MKVASLLLSKSILSCILPQDAIFVPVCSYESNSASDKSAGVTVYSVEYAREKGLEPLADLIMLQMTKTPALKEAESYIDPEKGVETAEDALNGAKDILEVINIA